MRRSSQGSLRGVVGFTPLGSVYAGGLQSRVRGHAIT